RSDRDRNSLGRQFLLIYVGPSRERHFKNLLCGQNRGVVAFGHNPCFPPSAWNSVYGQSSHPVRKHRVRGGGKGFALGLQSQQRANSQHRRARRPRLRQAGSWILHRKTSLLPRISGEDLWQPRAEEQACFENSRDDGGCIFAEAVSRESRRNNAAVVRPHSPVVIFNGIVAAL